MATNSNLERWLDGEALDESLADHDAKYHGGHFDHKTMSCGKRDSQAEGDDPKLGGAEEKKKPGEAAKGSKDKYDLEYDAVSEEAKTMSDKDLWKIVNDIEDEEWSNNKSEYCEAMGRPASEWDDSRSDFQDEIESSLYGYDPIYTAYKDEAERREKGGGAVSAQDAAAKEYLALCQDAGKVRKHADGSICKAASPETCPFNKKAEAAEKAISEKKFAIDADRIISKLNFHKTSGRGIAPTDGMIVRIKGEKNPFVVMKTDATKFPYVLDVVGRDGNMKSILSSDITEYWGGYDDDQQGKAVSQRLLARLGITPPDYWMVSREHICGDFVDGKMKHFPSEKEVYQKGVKWFFKDDDKPVPGFND